MLAEDTIKRLSLWATNGTSKGTVYVGQWTGPTDVDSSYFGTRLGKDRIVFPMQSDLWVTNGKPQGTKKIYSFEGGAAIRSLRGFANKGFALFSGYTTKHGRELWRTDGTHDGTVLVKDIMRYNSSSEPFGFHLHRGKIYFSAESDGKGRELWQTDGTQNKTVLVDDINRGRPFSDPGQFISLGKRLFFTATHKSQRMAFYLAPSGRARLVDPGGFAVHRAFFKAGTRIVWYTSGKGFRSTNQGLNVLAFGANITAEKKIDSAEICQ